MSSVSASFLISLLNGILQLVMVVWVILLELPDPRSVSHRLHTDIAFLAFLSTTFLVQALVKVLEAFQAADHLLFLAVGVTSVLEFAGWFLLIGFYDNSTAHYTGVGLFVAGLSLQTLSLLIYHQTDRKHTCMPWWLFWLWGLYSVSFLFVVAFLICFGIESVRLEYLFEWLALAIYAVADLGYMLAYSMDVF